MAITTSMTHQFKRDILEGGIHVLKTTGGDTLKLALFTSAVTFDASSVTYNNTNEVVGAGYTEGGVTLAYSANQPELFTNTMTLNFANPTPWTSASFTANGACIYNSSKSNLIISTHAFGSDRVVTDGTFTITMPAAGAGTSIIRIA